MGTFHTLRRTFPHFMRCCELDEYNIRPETFDCNVILMKSGDQTNLGINVSQRQIYIFQITLNWISHA